MLPTTGQSLSGSPTPSPYRYESMARTRRWVPWIKHLLLQLGLAHVANRWRGRTDFSDYTGGWNATPNQPQLELKRLNLGCGQANYEGYINLDIGIRPHLYIQAAGQQLPFASESFDEVLCTDVIEHLTAEAGRQLLVEVNRILRHQGHLVLVTPDLDGIMLAYRSHFANYKQVIQHLLGDARDHRYLYTLPTLAEATRATGLMVERGIRHWGPIWAHLVILAKKI